MSIKLKNISFRYDGQNENIINDLTISFHNGFSAIVGANGLGKTTLVNIITGEIKPDSGTIEFDSEYSTIGYSKQDTHDTPKNILSIFDNNKKAGYMRSLLKIEHDFFNRYDSLSFGEKKRVQIACVLIEEPDILILDEVTNHIDAECREVLINALKLFKGVCLIISHDRYFLDTLVDNCLLIRKDTITMRSGKYSDCLEDEKIDNNYRLKLYEKSKTNVKKLDKRYKETKSKADQKRKRSISKSSVDKKDHDTKAKIDAARLTGKDSKMSKQVSNVHTLYKKSIEEKNNLYFANEKSLSIDLQGERAKNKILFHLPSSTIKLNENKKLITKEITIKHDSKIGLIGFNGAGKSSLIKYILDQITIPEDKILYIPQEINNAQWVEIYKKISQADNSDFGLIISMIDRLGSNAKVVLSSSSHSPGEMRKLMLAFGLLKKPYIIIMDEPTNHLDISSIERLEENLKNINSAILLVSHDITFLSNIVSEKWVFSKKGNDSLLDVSENIVDNFY